jgi:hypothetical protein
MDSHASPHAPSRLAQQKQEWWLSRWRAAAASAQRCLLAAAAAAVAAASNALALRGSRGARSGCGLRLRLSRPRHARFLVLGPITRLAR